MRDWNPKIDTAPPLGSDMTETALNMKVDLKYASQRRGVYFAQKQASCRISSTR